MAGEITPERIAAGDFCPNCHRQPNRNPHPGLELRGDYGCLCGTWWIEAEGVWKAPTDLNQRKPDPTLADLRYLARLAWNGWPDTEEARKRIAEHEARDPYSARAWDRVLHVIIRETLRDNT